MTDSLVGHLGECNRETIANLARCLAPRDRECYRRDADLSRALPTGDRALPPTTTEG
jgi:hypothetical protein